MGSSFLDCTSNNQCQEDGICNPLTGQCVITHKLNGTSCDDNDACTKTDQCNNGQCVGKLNEKNGKF